MRHPESPLHDDPGQSAEDAGPQTGNEAISEEPVKRNGRVKRGAGRKSGGGKHEAPAEKHHEVLETATNTSEASPDSAEIDPDSGNVRIAGQPVEKPGTGVLPILSAELSEELARARVPASDGNGMVLSLPALKEMKATDLAKMARQLNLESAGVKKQ
jgi:hypothetical protein